MRAKYLKLTNEPASLLLIAICFVLILVPPLVQALHFHLGSSNTNHCSICQAINSSVLTLPLVVVWTALTAIALVPLLVESAPKQHVDQFSLLSRPPPLY
jgi:LSD1 subclass zinc finger protein